MRLYISAFIFVLVASFAPHIRAAEMGIAVVVNEDAISYSDLNDRYRLILASSRIPDSPQVRQRLMPQIVGSLIEEQLKFQEAARNDVDVSQEEINNGFATIAQQNGLEPDQFQQALEQSGINIETMYRQIRSQLMWSKVVSKRLRPQVNVSESDIDTVLNRLKDNVGSYEYLASEIYLPIEKPSEEEQVRDLARNLSLDMQAGKVPFFRIAQQFSKAPGAPQGGDLGWVQAGQLSRELDDVLVTLEPEQVSNPIRSLGGYHILLVRQKRQISEDNMPDRDQIATSLGMERLERLQQRLLLDLKSSAFIEDRLVAPE
ncbi:MAG: rotamase [Alphaproteobacteria bacterium]|nr:rotamase [Alphaproteobacteria bacterium]